MGVVKNSYTCSLTLAMDIAGGKWKMVILWHLRNGTLRFSELKRLLEGITQKMLTQQLRELEEVALITRTVYPVVPPKVEYALNVEGQKLIPALEALCEWSSDYAVAHGIADASGCSYQPVKKGTEEPPKGLSPGLAPVDDRKNTTRGS